MSALIEAILLLGLAAGPDESEALADLARRIGPDTAAPAKPQQEDPRPQRPDAPVQAPEEPSTPWIDFDWFELHVRVGMALFSKEFHIDPSPTFVIEGRAPMPWLSPGSNPDGDYFGAFAEIAFTSIKRTITPAVDKPSGAMMSMTIGIDYTILRNTTWMVLARVGIQYTTYGGVTDLQDGMGPMVGLTAGLTISRSVSITISPEYIKGASGDNIIIGTLGVGIDF